MSKTIINFLSNGEVLLQKSFYSVKSFYSNIIFRRSRSTVTNILQFRVRFTNFSFEAYGADNPAPIGIAVLNRNNYII